MTVWLCLLVLAVVIRGGVLVARPGGLNDDPDAYRRLAVHLIQDGVYGHPVGEGPEADRTVRPTAFRPPLYPILLAVFGWTSKVSSWSVAVLHLILGVVTVLVTYRIALRWGLENWAVLPPVLVACDPILLNQSTLVMTETPATFLAVLALGLLPNQKGNQKGVRNLFSKRFLTPFVAGGGMALAALCRPTFLIWLAACFCVVAVTGRVRSWKSTAAFFLGACLVLAPWIVRNYVVLGSPVVATTHGGYTLLLGNNEGFYRHLGQAPFGAVWDSAELDAEVSRVKATLNHDELAADRWAGEQARQAIRQNPSMFLYACAVRVGRLWRPAPHALSPEEPPRTRLVRYAIGLWYTAAFGFAIVGCWRLGSHLLRQPWLWGLLLCLAFTSLHTFYWSNLRMRAPLMPVVYLAAAVALYRPASISGAGRSGHGTNTTTL